MTIPYQKYTGSIILEEDDLYINGEDIARYFAAIAPHAQELQTMIIHEMWRIEKPTLLSLRLDGEKFAELTVTSRGEIVCFDDFPSFQEVMYINSGLGLSHVWIEDSNYHRICGPAKMDYTQQNRRIDQEWYIRGNEITSEEEFLDSLLPDEREDGLAALLKYKF